MGSWDGNETAEQRRIEKGKLGRDAAIQECINGGIDTWIELGHLIEVA
jgi:hypothetical protein